MNAPLARDTFDRVLAEKLWTLIPPVYRDGDSEGDNPGSLRALIELLATQAAHLRRSHDQLWDDQMIELCADWAVPYIGALLGTRVLPKDAGRGARIDVAKTIYYRKRKGTPAILEQLAADITGWDGVLVEGFQRLARMPHGLDAPRDALKWAAIAPLADPLAMGRTGGPFDQFQHTPTTARPKGTKGRYAINRMTLHLHRLRTVPLQSVAPRPQGVVADAYTFDPSGRDIPLFARRGRSDASGDVLDWDGWSPARPWDVGAPIRCRLLGEEVFRLSVATQQMLGVLGLTDPVIDELWPLLGRDLAGISRLRKALLTCASSATLLVPATLTAIRDEALVADCGKSQLIPRSIRVESTVAEMPALSQINAGSLADWDDPRATSGLVIDPERGRFRFPGGTPPGRLTVDHFAGHADTIGAGGFARKTDLPTPNTFRNAGEAIAAIHLPINGALRLNDSATWGQPANRTGIGALNIHARAGHRPYVRLTNDWTLTARNSGNATLHIDGLWVGAENAGLSLILDGDWEEVRLSNVTFDPGGAQTADSGSNILPALTLTVAGRVENLIITDSICGRLRTTGTGQIETLTASDSIFQTRLGLARLPQTDINLDRCTVIGALQGRRINVSNSIITGRVRPRDQQAGCFRFSAAGRRSVLPKPYRPYAISLGQVLFASQRFGDPDFARLRRYAPDGVRGGGEDGQEMGAFHRLFDNARLAGLKTKISEYAPFGILPIYQFET